MKYGSADKLIFNFTYIWDFVSVKVSFKCQSIQSKNHLKGESQYGIT